jgi:uncharacterized membrane protein YkgB
VIYQEAISEVCVDFLLIEPGVWVPGLRTCGIMILVGMGLWGLIEYLLLTTFGISAFRFRLYGIT